MTDQTDTPKPRRTARKSDTEKVVVRRPNLYEDAVTLARLVDSAFGELLDAETIESSTPMVHFRMAIAARGILKRVEDAGAPETGR